MAETERPHRSSSINSSNTANASSSTDLFICFTSRFSSSSSMRLSSLSPARSACLTTSLSRRLRTSGSLKNASAAGVLNSPMFGANGRKRSGSGYDNNNNNNIEPSSPKVTCIGQVRVKTRKHVKKKMRARSRRKGETSFRRSSSDQNDGGGCRFDATENRWVHLPVTICESLRAFGSELNCFFPCRSSCTDSSHHDRDRDGRRVEGNGDGCGGGGNSCGAVFTRWFVAVEETGGRRREIELVVGGEDDAEEDRRSRRRHVFEGLDLSEIEMKTEEKKEREEVGRISICSPPKNALLLMRCRSDPVKVAALANRVRERQLSLNDVAQGGDEEDDEERRRRFELDLEDKKRIELCEKWISGETTVEEQVVAPAPAPVAEAQVSLASNPAKEEETVQVLEDSTVQAEEEEASKIQEVDSFDEEIEATFIKSIENDIRNAIEEEEHMAEMEELSAAAKAEEEEQEESREIASVTPNVERSEQGNREPDPSPEVITRGSQLEETTTEKEKTTPYKVLPDCLLLMMCEPKLSMEVSKETWVCSTDFVRCLPGRPPAKKIPETAGDHNHQPKKRTVVAVDSTASSRRRSIDKPPVHHAMLQPPRSSCSYPAAPPIITAAVGVGEQKVAGANKVYEPPVLPRCKSEPRKSASKLAPEACFWKNRKLEPHPPATVGVGGAGVGF
ncbi:hypothetical protein EUTSA_v10020211mg [Eutrema salsugineum]|uniref:Uncharacterized protein n=1 Tax=Eutrema salsugineum TaxID=72664 RepID=V4M7X5_EUTSA|nr:uncharacterized protein LOC18023583 [Eutrema salsugineum]ESQ48468.1 hypothetical protein EUTSA_v10020211mg [Eutrema salsugineum]